MKIQQATGARVHAGSFREHADRQWRITDAGAGEQAGAVQNTRAINACLRQASLSGGGTVIVPAGIYAVYTIRLCSDVTLHLEKGAVLRAARGEAEGGAYDEPEINPYVGIQDHGHSYLANSLVYGKELHRVAITGPGIFDGSNYHSRKPGEPLEYVLDRWDPPTPEKRNQPGHRGSWFGNKGIALDRCEEVLLQDFTFLMGGHFALLLSGCRDLCISGITVDTVRDGIDLDGCEDVTVTRTAVNTPNDDAICLKASFGMQEFRPVRNILVEDCRVTGFDAGSVFAGTFERNRQAATDRCPPTGRFKFGTEASCGCDTVTVRRVQFIRSRGICLESCDTADLHDILIEDCRMRNVSSSPIFIRLGLRNRFPVTGYTGDETLGGVNSDPVPTRPEDGAALRSSPRLDHREWVMPLGKGYPFFPTTGYLPAVKRDRRVTVDGVSHFTVPDEACPCRINPDNIVAEGEGERTVYYLKRFDGERFTADRSREIPEQELPLYANAHGGAGGNNIARAWNIVLRNIAAEDVDPRYPILIQGLSDSRIRDIRLENIRVEYRGGMTMDMAVEQRQVNTQWNFSSFGMREDTQILPWMVNTFFAKNEGLLPRADWNPEKGGWTEDPYNVPELADVYPEPSNYGILPAFGLYARHAENLILQDVEFTCCVPDERDMIVLDDVRRCKITGGCVGTVAAVEADCRRPSGLEMVPNMPYHTEKVEGLETDGRQRIREIRIYAPAPGTPPDSLYPYPTSPLPENGYSYKIPTDRYPLPRGVYRPYIARYTAQTKENRVQVTLILRDPAGDEQGAFADAGTGEILTMEPIVRPQPTEIRLEARWHGAGKRLQTLTCRKDSAYTGHGTAYTVLLPEGATWPPEGDDWMEILLDDGFRKETERLPQRQDASFH